MEYGTATLERQADGRVVVVQANRVIGISMELLAQAGNNLHVDMSGCLLLAGDPNYRYRPVRFSADPIVGASGPCAVLVCQRVES